MSVNSYKLHLPLSSFSIFFLFTYPTLHFTLSHYDHFPQTTEEVQKPGHNPSLASHPQAVLVVMVTMPFRAGNLAARK